MALIKFGPVISDARGSVGGTVFSRNAAGAIMKQRTTPTYPASQKQQERASLLSTIIEDWQGTLTTPERNAWNALAQITSLPNKLGEQFTPSGLNLYVRSNCMLDLTAQAHVVVPPVSAVGPSPTFTLIWTTLIGIEVSAIGNFDTAGAAKLLTQRSAPLPLSINYFKGPYTLIYAMNGAYFDILPALLFPSAQLVATSRYFFKWRAVDSDGTVSAPAYYSVDVGAVP